MGSIYKITNLATGRVYVGLTQRTVEERFAEHCSATGWCNAALHADIVALGAFRFRAEAVEQGIEDATLLAQRERYWIQKLQAYNPSKGYNRTRGGEVNPFYGLTKEQRCSKLLAMQVAEATQYYRTELVQLLRDFDENGSWWYEDGWYLTSNEQKQLFALQKRLRAGIAFDDIVDALEWVESISPSFHYDVLLQRDKASRGERTAEQDVTICKPAIHSKPSTPVVVVAPKAKEQL